MVYLIQQILDHWLTTTLIITNTVIWFCVNQFRVPTQSVSFNYKLIVADGQWWRIVTSAFSHYSFMHILFNMFSLWSFRFLEVLYGQVLYVELTLLLLILSSVFTLLFYKALMRFLHWNHYYEHVHAVGYSAVIFGLLTVGSLLNPKGKIELLFGLKIPSMVVPFFYLVVSSLLFPQASFVGHLSGILAGLTERFVFSYWLYKIPYHISLIVMSVGFLAAMAWSLKLHNRFFNRGNGGRGSSDGSGAVDSTIIGDTSIVGSVFPGISRLNPWRRNVGSSSGGFTMLNGMLMPRNSTSAGLSNGQPISGRVLGSASPADRTNSSLINNAGQAALARFNASSNSSAQTISPSASQSNQGATTISIEQQPYTFVDLTSEYHGSNSVEQDQSPKQARNVIVHSSTNSNPHSINNVSNNGMKQNDDAIFDLQYQDTLLHDETEDHLLLQRGHDSH